jgi:hypothetical protein
MFSNIWDSSFTLPWDRLYRNPHGKEGEIMRLATVGHLVYHTKPISSHWPLVAVLAVGVLESMMGSIPM